MAIDEVYFELADVSGDRVVAEFPLMRLCLALEVALEGKFLADMLGTTAADWHSQTLIEELCGLAISDENRFFMSRNTWLKMTVSLKNHPRFFGEPFCRDELTKSITIRRNVVPRKGYLKKLQELHWPREFYSSRVLQESRGISLMQILRERRNSGNRSCELARELAVSRQLSAGRNLVFHTVSFRDVGQLRILGKGSGGDVWEVVWRNCRYAMKSFKIEGNFKIEKAFADSRRVLHPHIVQVFGHGSIPGDRESEAEPCLFMELLDDTLERFLCQSIKSGPCISRVEKLDLLLQIASAIQKLHQNRVVHGDLKLGNILISTFEVSGDVRHLLAKIADFDTAVEIEPSAVDIAPLKGGSQKYASPELLRWRGDRNHRVGCKTDVYSFGVMAYEILTEHWAYDVPTVDDFFQRSEWTQYAAGTKTLIECIAWRDLKNCRILSNYFQEVIPLVESCLKFAPEQRPEISQILRELTRSKSKLQAREKKIADKQKNLIRLLAKFVCLFVIIAVLVSLLHYAYASAALMVVIVVTSACYSGNVVRKSLPHFRLKFLFRHAKR